MSLNLILLLMVSFFGLGYGVVMLYSCIIKLKEILGGK